MSCFDIQRTELTVYLLLICCASPKGTALWFNQANIHHPTWYTEMYPDTWGKSGIPFDKFPFQVYYGDGSQIKDEVIQVRFSRMQHQKNQQ